MLAVSLQRLFSTMECNVEHPGTECTVYRPPWACSERRSRHLETCIPGLVWGQVSSPGTPESFAELLHFRALQGQHTTVFTFTRSWYSGHHLGLEVGHLLFVGDFRAPKQEPWCGKTQGLLGSWPCCVVSPSRLGFFP